MTDKQWMAVFNLWYIRVCKGIYISDVPPYNLNPIELESLIIDSFYADIPLGAIVDPFHFDKMKLSYRLMCRIHITAINKHLAVQ